MAFAGLFCFVEISFHHGAQTDIEFMILLPQPMKCQDYRHVLPCLSASDFKSIPDLVRCVGSTAQKKHWRNQGCQSQQSIFFSRGKMNGVQSPVMPEWKVINQSSDSLLFHRSQPPPALLQYAEHCSDPMQSTECILMKGASCTLHPPPIEFVLMLIMNPSSSPSPALCLLANRIHYYCRGHKLCYV